jgi:energy-coupling factor transport system substrate-specific component
MNRKWFNFTTRDLVVIAILIAVSGVFQFAWSYLVFQAQVLGPFRLAFSSLGFMFWSFLAIYLVRKPGSATLVKGLGAVIEVLLGNPFGPVAIFYGAVEGLGVDIAFWLFRGQWNLNMMIVGALIAHALAGPVDVYRDAIPIQLDALVTYFTPGVIGKIWNTWIASLIISAMSRVGIKPIAQGQDNAVTRNDSQ